VLSQLRGTASNREFLQHLALTTPHAG